MTQRLFIGIFPPPDICDLLIDQMADLPGVRWQDEDQLHLTLRYLGDLNRHDCDALVDALSSIEFDRFDIILESAEAFRRKGQPRSIHRLVRPTEPLLRLTRSIDRRCEHVGLGRRDRRFLPHITLARLNAGSPQMEGYIASLKGTAGPDFTADRFTLVQSHLSRAGSIYEPLVDFLAE